MATVKTTRIEKKYTDKKTGELRTLMIDHAKVKDRLLAFWSDNPRGKIETSQKKEADQITFKAFILTDKADQFSKEATGHSYGQVGGEKSFEKLETIAVGRALALLGYAATGEIASSEEMEAFEEYKQQQFEESVLEWQDKLSEAEDLKALGTVWASVPPKVKLELTQVKDKLKAKYESK